MQLNEIEYQYTLPKPELSSFVESFWMIKNHSPEGKKIVILPDGRFDIIYFRVGSGPLQSVLRGLDTLPREAVIPGNSIMCAVSFKLPAVEYLLTNNVALLVNKGTRLSADFFDITESDLDDFRNFCDRLSSTLVSHVKKDIDIRKQKLFEMIYASDGSVRIKCLADHAGWSSRQISRYFQQRFGISPKAFCGILRFRGALHQLKKGLLFPEQNFCDQTHFIRAVKRFSGVLPKELAKNKNDRFILLSALTTK